MVSPSGKKEESSGSAELSTDELSLRNDELSGPTRKAIPDRRSTLHEKAKSEGINPLGLLLVALVMVD